MAAEHIDVIHVARADDHWRPREGKERNLIVHVRRGQVIRLIAALADSLSALPSLDLVSVSLRVVDTEVPNESDSPPGEKP